MNPNRRRCRISVIKAVLHAQDAILLTVVNGAADATNEVSIPHSVAEQVKREHGNEVLNAFKKLVTFDPPAPIGKH